MCGQNRFASLIACLSILLLSVFAGLLPAEDWPGFRGPNGAGVSADQRIPTHWGDNQNLQWKRELPGAGFSSPIVVGDRVLVTCYSDAEANLENLKRHLVCVDRQTGAIVWSKTVPSAAPERRMPSFAAPHGYASETPVSDGERVYVLMGNTGLFAFDLAGNQLWQQDVGRANASMYGSAVSPILYQDKLIVTAGSQSETIRCFDRRTGQQTWMNEAPSLSRCYATPIIVRNQQGRDELVYSAPEEAWGLNPASGKLLWYATTGVDLNSCPIPVAGEDGIIYVIGGRRGARAAVRLGGQDDVSQTHVLWRESGGSYVPSPVLHNGHLYWADHRGIAHCVDIKTGKEVSRQRLGGQFYASAVLIDGKVYAVSRFTGTHVLEATPELKQLAHNKLSDESDFSASPAVSDGQLFLRSDKALYCISAATATP